MPESNWSTEFVAKGRYGDMIYREDGYELKLYWEIGGASNVIFILFIPDDKTWAEKFAWAKGRRDEICLRVAQTMANQNCTSCRAEYHAEDNTYLIKSNIGG